MWKIILAHNVAGAGSETFLHEEGCHLLEFTAA
jgi:hypothetical protein